MTERVLHLHPEAIEEAHAAAQWYKDQSPVAADAFETEVGRAVQLIGDAPERWPKYMSGTRRFLLRRFPFYLVYRLHEGSIEVIAVAHGRRRPGYWKGRSA